MILHVRWRRLLVAGLLAVPLALPRAGTVSAHAALVRATIKPGQVFTRSTYPRLVTAVFSENVRPKGSFIHVFGGDPRGDYGAVDLYNVRFPFKNPKEISVGLPKGLKKGRYIFMWYTISADDGHAAGNAFSFTVR